MPLPFHDHIRPELELLAVCGRAGLDDAARERLRALLAAPLDWPEAIRLASRHGLIPLVHKHLREAATVNVPPDILTRLATLAGETGRVNLHMTAEMIRIVLALQREGVTATAIKGPALAQALYGSVALRQFGDLDLTIRPRDMSAAARVLRGLGYAADFADPDMDDGVHLRAYYEFSFTSADAGVHVEIHHRLSMPCFQSEHQVSDILDRAASMAVAGTAVPVLSAEDQFIYLCVHGAKHLWERLEWICAVAELMRGATHPDWPLVAARARAGGDTRLVAIAVLLAEALTGAPIPSTLEAAARRDRTARALAEQARRRLIREAPTPDPGETFVYSLRARGPRDRCLYCWFTLTTPSLADVAALRLPRRLHGLYAVSRPLRVIAAYASSMSRALLPR